MGWARQRVSTARAIRRPKLLASGTVSGSTISPANVPSAELSTGRRASTCQLAPVMVSVSTQLASGRPGVVSPASVSRPW